MGRGRNPEKRCERCRMLLTLCLCANMPRLWVPTKIVILMHFRETRLTTNTAGLTCLALPNSEICIRGTQHDPEACTRVVTQAIRPLLLYPSEQATELTPEAVKALPRPLTLIVPDGSWRQASKVAVREPSLAQVPHVKLAPGGKGAYRLRRAAQPHQLSTGEAIARAMGILEGAAIQEQLERLLTTMVQRTLWSRGTH